MRPRPSFRNLSRVDERVEVNRLRWDDMAELHIATYNIDSVDAAGRHLLRPFEPEELGPLVGKRVCHLQCHIGDDSFALAHLGAEEVVGADLSKRSIEIASMRARRTGLHDRVRFVQVAVDAAPGVLGTGFDVAYTSWGVLCWLPNLARWAEVVAALLRSGGFVYLAETHPYAKAVREPTCPYGGGEAMFFSGAGDYSDDTAVFEHPDQWEWSHGLGEIISALAGAGLRVDWVHEHPVVGWHLNDHQHLVERHDGMWEAPGCDLPLSFSLRATKP